MAVLENRPSKTLGFLHVFSSENDFFNTLLDERFWCAVAERASASADTAFRADVSQTCNAGSNETIVGASALREKPAVLPVCAKSSASGMRNALKC